MREAKRTQLFAPSSEYVDLTCVNAMFTFVRIHIALVEVIDPKARIQFFPNLQFCLLSTFSFVCAI